MIRYFLRLTFEQKLAPCSLDDAEKRARTNSSVRSKNPLSQQFAEGCHPAITLLAQ